MPHIPDTHADHDRLLVAAYAAGDASGAELDQALALVAACPECAALHHDLRAIAAAMPDLPPEGRPRDFRLTPEQAAGLRPAGWRRWLAPLAGPRFSFAAPLGTGLATLGIVGLLLAGSLGAPAADLAAGGAAAGAPGSPSVGVEAPAAGGEAENGAGTADGATAGTEAAGVESRASIEVPGDADIQGEGGWVAEPDGVLTAPEAQPVAPAGTSGPGEEAAAGTSATTTAGRQVLAASDSQGLASMPMLPALSGLFLLAGLGLLVLRLAGRRLGA